VRNVSRKFSATDTDSATRARIAKVAKAGVVRRTIMRMQRRFPTGSTLEQCRSTSFICHLYTSQSRTALVLSISTVDSAIVRALRSLAPTLEKLSAASFPRLPHMQLEACGSRTKWEPWCSSQAFVAEEPDLQKAVVVWSLSHPGFADLAKARKTRLAAVTRLRHRH
jgi:hypothetical protein